MQVFKRLSTELKTEAPLGADGFLMSKKDEPEEGTRAKGGDT
jgi:hypothetical protein|tara:strand:- start:140 stop:265 length:126 start_codon:yes stop_codon:yes gene_type:complete